MASTAFTSALWFLAILAMIPIALWLFKRSPAGARLTGGVHGGVLRHVAALPLSANQRIVTIEVGHGDSRRWLVLGVTAQSICTLYTVAPHDEAASAPAATGVPGMAPGFAPGFAQVLGRLRREKARS